MFCLFFSSFSIFYLKIVVSLDKPWLFIFLHSNCFYLFSPLTGINMCPRCPLISLGQACRGPFDFLINPFIKLFSLLWHHTPASDKTILFTSEFSVAFTSKAHSHSDFIG